VSKIAGYLRFLLFLFLPLSFLFGQVTPPPQLQPRPTEPSKIQQPAPSTVNRGEINLDVQVTDKSGAAILGLQKEDFAILDDKRPQSIGNFQAVHGSEPTPAQPVEIVLVVDAVNASYQTVGYERDQLKKFLLQNDGKLAQPTSLIFFTDAGMQMQNGSSRDGKALAALYDRYQTGMRTINRSQGFYGAAERLEMSLKALNSFVEYEQSRPGRKLMIWFSPGWPLLTGPGIQLSGQEEQHFFDSIVATSNGLRQARITLYSIDPLGLADAGGVRIDYYQEFLKGISRPDRALAADLSLQVLAVQSGGRVLNASNDLTHEVSTCASDAGSFYVLSFAAARADHPNEYHAIELTVDKPGAKARTRTGYYAQP